MRQNRVGGGRKSSRRVLARLKGGCEEREFPSFLYIFSYIPRRSLGKVCCLKQRALPPSINHCRVLVWLAHHRRHPSLLSLSSSPSNLTKSRRPAIRKYHRGVPPWKREAPSFSLLRNRARPTSFPASFCLPLCIRVYVCVCVFERKAFP